MAFQKKTPRNAKNLKRKQSRDRKAARNMQATAGEWFEKLVAVQARLRAPSGCPWDREQTHQSLRTFLIEEAYEVLEALDSRDDSKFAEEMGDLLLQIIFHSQIAREERRFTVCDVIREIHDKMIRRHPHVFGKTSAKDSAEVLKNWEHLKAEERRLKADKSDGRSGVKVEREASLLDGVSRSLPATLEGLQLTRRAARVGFDWEDAAGIFEKVNEETTELKNAMEFPDQARVEEELGDLLFAAVNLARFLKVDPEIALKKANAKFSRRFRGMEQIARRDRGREFKDLPRKEMETLWEASKRMGGEPRTEVVTGAHAKK